MDDGIMLIIGDDGIARSYDDTTGVCDMQKDVMIYKQAAIDEIRKCRFVVDAIEKIRGLPSAYPERAELVAA